MKLKKFLFCSIIIILTFKCSEKKIDPIAEAKIKEFCKPINYSKDIAGNPRYSYEIIKQFEKTLHLSPIENSNDSLTIRVWFDVLGIRSQHFVLNMHFQNEEWKGELIKFKDSESTKLPLRVFCFDIDKSRVKPKSGWNDLLNQVTLLDILILPNKVSGGGDGDTYVFEVSSKYRYRYYTYWCPFSSSEQTINTKKITQIIELLCKEFDIASEKC